MGPSQCADQQAEEDDQGKDGEYYQDLPLVFRFNIETGCRFLQACGEWAGPSSFGGTLEETLPVVGKPMGGRVAGGWVHGLGRAPGTEGEGVCEGKTRGGFLGAPLL